MSFKEPLRDRIRPENFIEPQATDALGQLRKSFQISQIIFEMISFLFKPSVSKLIDQKKVASLWKIESTFLGIERKPQPREDFSLHFCIVSPETEEAFSSG